jgi:serpin B
MKKISMKFCAAACSIVVVLVAGGCGMASSLDTVNNRKPDVVSYGDSVEVASVTAKDLLATGGEAPAERSISIAGGANDFAFRFASALAAESGNKNFVCSPYSVWLPLAALVNAAEESKKSELLSTLGAVGMGKDDINAAASRMLYDLTKVRETKNYAEYGEQYNNPLKIANAIFVSKELTLQDNFAQTFMDFYRGASIKVNFTSDDAVAAINKWASDNTEGLIDNVVTDFDPKTVVAIANAIYFSDRWGWEFEPKKTAEAVFHSPEGETKAFYMLREGDEQLYYEDDKAQALQLGFTSGGGMYIILPKDGDALGLLSSMTDDYFEQIQQEVTLATGKLLLPRFSIAGDPMNLRTTLIALGVPLFDTSGGSTLTGLVKEDIPLYLSDAVQKALIRVDEKGTTAAAVTLLMGATSAGPQEPTKSFEMICNKPFVFVLYDYTYDGGKQVLFTGMVNNP